MRLFSNKRYVCGLALLFLSLTIYACGHKENPESLSDSGESGPVPVAEWQYMDLPVSLGNIRKYTSNENWFYAASPHNYNREKQCSEWHVYRGEIADEYEPQPYVVHEGNNLITLLADREDNCYLFFTDMSKKGTLVKYNADGELVWEREYTAAELLGKGSRLDDGLVTEDGCVYLYDAGSEGSVFAFESDGSLARVCTPGLDVLEGIAEGQDKQVYGYCVTGDEPVLVNVREPEKSFVCPIRPLQVYGGCEDGIYLCTGEGLWQYTPETGESQMLWLWDDEYVQMEISQLDYMFRGKEEVCLVCRETVIGDLEVKTLAFASVDIRDRRDYPEKEVVTISRSSFHRYYDYESNMEELVRRYNRQSRKYRVVVLSPDKDISTSQEAQELLGAMELQLIRGEGPDIIEVKGLDVSNLAAKGAFEDLTDYYKSSERVKAEDILESVREANTVMGKNVLVFPCFEMDTMYSREDIDAKEWTPLRFLELMQKDGRNMSGGGASRMFAFLYYCMGVKTADYFIDYERKECRFDSDEFRQILEGLDDWIDPEPFFAPPNLKVGDVVPQSVVESRQSNDEWIFQSNGVWSTADIINSREEGLVPIGYPGWNGAENVMKTMDAFAINSASEHKEGAWDFLEFLLSEEMQNRISWEFPVRKDSFERYMADSYRSAENECKEFNYFHGEYLQQATQEDFDTIREILDSAVYQYPGNGYSSNPLRIILEEEAQMYYAGDATLEETVKKIQSRATLWLNEL